VVPWVHPDQPFLDRIRWIIINNKAAALKALRAGEVDADFDVEPSTWAESETNAPEFLADFVRARFLQPLYTYIGWNQDRKGVGPERQFFADARVRQAMTLLIPRGQILSEIHHGLGEVVTGPFFKYGPYADQEIEADPANLRRAQLLLDAAGWIDHDGDGVRDRDGVRFEFDYVIHNMRDYHQKIADIVKESVERAGVRMNIRKLDWAVFVDTVQDQQFDAVRFAWGEPNCIATDPFQIWHSSQAGGRGSNYISFKNDAADQIILSARRELDIVRRQRLLRRFHRLLHREQPYTFLFNFYSLYFYARRFRNVRFCIIGEDPYRWDQWYVPRRLQRER
jgi:peptide/nickel transport system substrate-binding protein